MMLLGPMPLEPTPAATWLLDPAAGHPGGLTWRRRYVPAGLPDPIVVAEQPVSRLPDHWSGALRWGWHQLTVRRRWRSWRHGWRGRRRLQNDLGSRRRAGLFVNTAARRRSAPTVTQGVRSPVIIHPPSDHQPRRSHRTAVAPNGLAARPPAASASRHTDLAASSSSSRPKSSGQDANTSRAPAPTVAAESFRPAVVAVRSAL